MSLPTESQLQQLLGEQRAQFESDLTREMLDAAKSKCFPKCFIGSHLVDANTSSSFATSIGSSTTGVQQSCLANCVDKFIEARTIVFKQTIKAASK